jgi:hypothetical protein
MAPHTGNADQPTIFVSHDLAVIRQVSSRVVVLYLGAVIEDRSTESLFDDPPAPLHPGADGRGAEAGFAKGARIRALAGEAPSPVDRPSGCGVQITDRGCAGRLLSCRCGRLRSAVDMLASDEEEARDQLRSATPGVHHIKIRPVLYGACLQDSARWQENVRQVSSLPLPIPGLAGRRRPEGAETHPSSPGR